MLQRYEYALEYPSPLGLPKRAYDRTLSPMARLHPHADFDFGHPTSPALSAGAGGTRARPGTRSGSGGDLHSRILLVLTRTPGVLVPEPALGRRRDVASADGEVAEALALKALEGVALDHGS
jgi:hypothetical protein